jgi:PAS domain S-box-containing protein
MAPVSTDESLISLLGPERIQPLLDHFAAGLHRGLAVQALREKPDQALVVPAARCRHAACADRFGLGCATKPLRDCGSGRLWLCRCGGTVATWDLELPPVGPVRVLLGPAQAGEERSDWQCLLQQVEMLAETLRALSDGVVVNRRLASDLESRKAAQELLAGRMEFLQQLLDRIPCPVFYKDRAGRYLGCNEEFSRMILGIGRHEIIGRTVFDLSERIPADLARRYHEQDQQLFQSGGLQVYEAPVQLCDGSSRFYEFHKSVFPDRTGRTAGLVGVMLDITDRVQFAEALAEARDTAEAANRTKSDFLAQISHEIRTPMTGVLGLSELLSRTSLDVQQRGYLDGIAGSARSLLEILDDILDFARIDAGQIQVRREPFVLADCLVGSLRLVSTQAARKGLALDCRIQPDCPRRVVGDPVRLRQVLVNLVSHAVNSAQTGAVELACGVSREADGAIGLEISVRDSRPAVSTDQRRRIRETIDHGGSDCPSGPSGQLGLTICSKLVSMMSGRLWMESGSNAGSVFRLQIPVGPAEPGQQADSDRRPQENLRVLVVSPRQAVRSRLSGILQRWSVPCSQAQDAVETQTLLAQSIEQRRLFTHVIVHESIPDRCFESLCRQIESNDDLGRPCGIFLSLVPCPERPLPAGWKRLACPVLDSELREELSGTAPSGAPVGVQPGARALRILVAEDNSVNQLLLNQLLREMGHHVTAAANGVEALVHIESNQLDVVFMDVQMPEMDGLQAVGALRQREEILGSHLPVIALTAHAAEADRVRCIEAGMDGYLTKPVHPEALRAALAEMVGPEEPVGESGRAVQPESE